MSRRYTQAELEAYLEEGLPPGEMAVLESSLREQPKLVDQLSMINGRRDAGLHSLGAIWRRHRLSCPSREQLGSYLLNALGAEHCEYVAFHVEKIGCRFCRANLEDLKRRQTEASEAVETRHQKYFHTSQGYLRGE